MSSFSSGRIAETRAQEYVFNKGYEILSTNWRTRWCEIDIVARRDFCVYFFEVKYRKSTLAGAGLDYITPRKLQQMARAAESWVQTKHWDIPYCLAVIELSGPEFEVTAFLTDL